MKLSMITLGVSDPEASLVFYRDGLGWPVRGRDGDLIRFETGETRLALYPLADLDSACGVALTPGRPASLHSVNVETNAAVDAIVGRVEERGGRVHRPATALPWGGYGAFVADPDGHLWEIVHAG